MTIQLQKALAGLTLLFALTCSTVNAGEIDIDQDIQRVRGELLKMIPQANDAEIVASPIARVYRLQIQGNFAYAYVDGDFVLLGDLYNTREKVNLGDRAHGERLSAQIKTVPTSKMIVFGPENAKRHITVFTDIDCGFCRKLHREVPQLTEAGIQVRYLAFPRKGIGSDSFDKYVSVWCSDDQQSALTAAKAGQVMARTSCSNPIAETYKLGMDIGVTGTPTIIFDNGVVTPGYISYDRIIEQLEMNQG